MPTRLGHSGAAVEHEKCVAGHHSKVSCELEIRVEHEVVAGIYTPYSVRLNGLVYPDFTQNQGLDGLVLPTVLVFSSALKGIASVDLEKCLFDQMVLRCCIGNEPCILQFIHVRIPSDGDQSTVRKYARVGHGDLFYAFALKHILSHQIRGMCAQEVKRVLIRLN